MEITEISSRLAVLPPSADYRRRPFPRSGPIFQEPIGGGGERKFKRKDREVSQFLDRLATLCWEKGPYHHGGSSRLAAKAAALVLLTDPRTTSDCVTCSCASRVVPASLRALDVCHERLETPLSDFPRVIETPAGNHESSSTGHAKSPRGAYDASVASIAQPPARATHVRGGGPVLPFARARSADGLASPRTHSAPGAVVEAPPPPPPAPPRWRVEVIYGSRCSTRSPFLLSLHPASSPQSYFVTTSPPHVPTTSKGHNESSPSSAAEERCIPAGC
ncbi:hypothetical protein HPB51_021380 [Rhipicephalus microplus]|uniref:Uncharacterized protein n=1 Tax=Rhipicephalus microplus TaxID=6941 RepID=A0A9J6F9L4_RHIMP|nr:hypothetical protein HPB51_021380 [Rhipicephalus microplus]